MTERLQKLIARSGLCSRRAAEALLTEGRVTVNGAAARLGDKADPETDAIAVDGKPLTFAEPMVYLMLNKPRGYVTTLSDELGRATAAQLVADCGVRVFPVGRLDKDTEGLLLLTDDGELTHRLLSPRYHVDKVYYAKVEGVPNAADAEAFADGLLLEDGLQCLPAKLEPLGGDACLVTLREGKFHQVKRMLASRGKPVRYLKRLSMGPLRLEDTLLPGQCRELSPEELAAVRSACML